MLRVDVIKCLDHWMSQLLLDPPALGQTGLDRFDSSITLSRIVVTSVDDDAPDRVREQIGGQFGDVLLGNRNDNEVLVARCLRHRNRRGAGFGRQGGEAFGTARVRHRDGVSKRPQPAGECAADVLAPMIPMFMLAPLAEVSETAHYPRCPRARREFPGRDIASDVDDGGTLRDQPRDEAAHPANRAAPSTPKTTMRPA